MGAGALTICHNKAAVQIKQDMKKMVQLPMLRGTSRGPRGVEARGGRLFGVSLLELRELGLVKDGVPLVVRSMVEFLREHALHHEGLFRVNGNVRAVEGLKQRLENGEDVDFLVEADVCTVASLFKQYLRDLPEGLVDSTVQPALIKQHQESSEEGFCSDLRVLLRQLPDVHYSLLQYLCLFLTQVDQRHRENLMTALNLATVFGPNVFHVSSGFDGIQEQNICNKIMAKLIQNYSSIFNNIHQDDDHKEEHCVFNRDGNIIIVKEAKETPVNRTDTESPKTLGTTPVTPTHTQKTPIPVPRKKKAASSSPPDDTKSSKELSKDNPIITPRKQKVRKVKHETATVLRAVPLPSLSPGLPYVRPLVLPVPLAPEVRSPRPERMDLTPPGAPKEPQGPAMDAWDVSAVKTTEVLNSSQEEDSRPISPFYISNHLSSVRCRSDLTNVLERTIRSAVEQHLFDVHMCGGGQSTTEDSEWTGCSSSPVVTPTARQRRRHQREQEEAQRHRDRSRSSSLGEGDINKENIPAAGSVSRTISCGVSVGEEGVWRDYQTSQGGLHHEGPRPRKPKHCHQSPTLGQLSDNQDPHALKECISRVHDEAGTNNMESSDNRNDSQRKDPSLLTPSWTRLSSMKIQELPSSCETADRRGVIGRSSDQECGEDVPRLDLSALTDDNNWGEPVPAYSSWQRESMDSEEACISPQVGGRLIRQLIEEDSDPMLSPRFHAYGHCQQYIDDTEVPPSPPNTHSFASRRRSSSLGSCGDDDQQELTSAQLSKKIHGLKRKIHKYEEKFEEERKYRPSHSDKADNPEVLKWMNELAKLRKDLKEHKLHKSEEDLPPLTRQRSNTLPKSFGSQLEKKPQQEKAPKPPVENTLEGVQNKLQEKRDEVGRPEDVKDMTREQIGAEKVALQKALLYYEGIHGRPVTKTERQIMKPLYDRYRLVKQILCRASTIPVIEEEDGSEDDSESNNKPQITGTVRPDFSMLGFLDQLEEETDGFISPVDELSPSKNTTDMRLSNLHSATMPELVEQLQEAREEKKRIRKNLREFEDQFFRQNGRNVQKEDRSPLAVEYNEYKHIKAKLRLIEVLISKGDASKFT